MVKKEKPKIIFTTGKRKKAVARAKAISGTGIVKINSVPLQIWGNGSVRLFVKEPLVLAGEAAKKVDIFVNVRSGGIWGQAEASRMAIARALLESSKSTELRQKFLQYDRNLLVYDPRRTEPHHPGASKRGSRRHKQRSKR